MSNEVLIAVLSLLGTAIGSGSGVFAGIKLITYRVEQLEKKVDKHNNLVERTYDLEARLDVVEEKQSVANHRIADNEAEIEKNRNKIIDLTRR